MVAVTLYLGIIAVALAVAYIKFLSRSRRSNEPPIPKGHWLWGNGQDFAEHAVKFLQKTQKSLGDIFTIRFFHQHLTIISSPHDYELMVKEKNFDFDTIQRQVNHNVFSFALVDARKMLKEAGKTVKGPHLVKGMGQYARYLNQSYIDVTQTPTENEWHTDGLRAFNAKTLFSALFYSIFGKGETAPSFEPNTMFKSFDAFHKYFNYLWFGMPVKMFPNAVKALQVLCKQPSSSELLDREDVSEYIKFSTKFMLEHGQSEQDIVGHNLVYLHVNYNTFRLAFWAVYYLLDHPGALDALREEVRQVVESKLDDVDEEGRIQFTLDEVDSLKILDSIIKETLRISSGVFMVRAITEDTEFTSHNGRTYSFRKGDKVAMYPPAIHKDPEIFENPEDYKYDRFIDSKFYKDGLEVKNPILSFGSLCPGKKYAITQSKWFLLSLVHQFDIELCEGEKASLDAHYHGHEILPPTNEVQIRYKPRDDGHDLIFI